MMIWPRVVLLCMAIAAVCSQPPPQGLLSNVFGDHMVFQSGAPIAVWGFAAAGTVVTVTFAGSRGSAAANATGQWRVSLPAAAAPGGPYTLVASTASASVTLVDVYVGTVLLCSGQSNLSGATTPLLYAFNGTASASESASFPLVRLFAVGERATTGLLPPQAQLGYAPFLPWSVAAPNTTAVFSAVCWMTAKVLAQQLGPAHAIGLIETAWSGTCIQAWLPADALASCGPVPAAQGWQTNSTLYNQMVAPIAGLTVAGFVWYQGESNAIFYQRGYYACALPALLASWRAAFGNPAAWWGLVQLAPWSQGAGPIADAVAATRAVQLAVALADAHASVATAFDLGDHDAPKSSIHPRPKQEVGRRLAAGAMRDLFGAGAAHDAAGPVYAAAAAGGGAAGVLSATVRFAPPFDAPGSLALASVAPWPGVTNASVCNAGDAAICVGFQLQAQGSGTWWPATATLSTDASAVVLSAPAAPAGALLNATASGWGLWPLVSLYASAAAGGLPAYPWQSAVAAG